MNQPVHAYTAPLCCLSFACALAYADIGQAQTIELYDAPTNHSAVSTLASEFALARRISLSIPIATTGSDGAIAYLCQAEALASPRIAFVDRVPLATEHSACQANGVELVGEQLPWSGEHFIVVRKRDTLTNGLTRQMYDFAFGRIDAAALATAPVPPTPTSSPSFGTGIGSPGAASPGSALAPNPGTVTGSWFVIAGSFPQANPSEARHQEDRLRALGFPAVTIDTNNYPNLSNGLYAVVLGPSDRATAELNLNVIRGTVGDAYLKDGGL
ncbi:MAG: SPOR domain-containing protein [bacterium]|nr:SPOR domain-containing protein [bacterium]